MLVPGSGTTWLPARRGRPGTPPEASMWPALQHARAHLPTMPSRWPQGLCVEVLSPLLCGFTALTQQAWGLRSPPAEGPPAPTRSKAFSHTPPPASLPGNLASARPPQSGGPAREGLQLLPSSALPPPARLDADLLSKRISECHLERSPGAQLKSPPSPGGRKPSSCSLELPTAQATARRTPGKTTAWSSSSPGHVPSSPASAVQPWASVPPCLGPGVLIHTQSWRGQHSPLRGTWRTQRAETHAVAVGESVRDSRSPSLWSILGGGGTSPQSALSRGSDSLDSRAMAGVYLRPLPPLLAEGP